MMVKFYFFDRSGFPSVGCVRNDPWMKLKLLDIQYIRCEAKSETPLGFLHKPEIPEWKWEKITMEFVTKLPKSSSGHDTIWVIVDRLTKSAHFLPIREDYKTEKLAKIYTNEIVARQWVRVNHFNRDGHSQSYLWYKAFKEALGTRLGHATAYTLQTDGQLIGQEIVQETIDKNVQIKERLKTARSRQSKLADKKAKPLEIEFQPIELFERDVKNAKTEKNPISQSSWNSRQGAEYTWEREDQFQKKYPHLFSKPVPSSNVAT
ncbi:putative reverse transcriptase domain-containing protein [Tanacetum coccineum]